MPSYSENLSSDYSLSSISSNSIEYRAWKSCVLQNNLHTDRIIEDVIINYPDLVIEDQPSRVRRVYRDRKCEKGHTQLIADYFENNPTYNQGMFRRRFRMHKHLFCRIVDVVTTNDQYFLKRPDATGRQGLSSYQKCTADMWVLDYGTSYDAIDEYLRMSVVVTRKALMKFIECVISCFGDKYLKKPNEDDSVRLLSVEEQRRFPCMIGSIDCMHWQWKKCPTAWAGQYVGRSRKPTIILKVVASYDLWI